jgi:hypothetical protein
VQGLLALLCASLILISPVGNQHNQLMPFGVRNMQFALGNINERC